MQKKYEYCDKLGLRNAPIDPKTGPGFALSVVNHIAIPSPYKCPEFPEI